MLASGGGAGGSSVGKNYISSYNNGTCNGDFETGNASGWNICSVASITNGVPSTLTLSGSGVTASVINSGQLAGQYSYQTVFSSTSVLNGFCSDPFTIDLEDQAKVLTFKFYYNVTGNATSGNFSGTSSNTFIVSIYDETTDTFIQPAGLYSMVQSSGSGVATGTFQTPLGSSQYRLVVLCANNPSANITVVWDDFFVGPQISVNAPAMSDWIDESSLFGVTGDTSPTKYIYTKRQGDTLFVRGTVTIGSVDGSTFSIDLPAKYKIDYSKITTTSLVQIVGNCTIEGNAVTAFTSATAGVTQIFTDGSNNGSVFVTQYYGSQGLVKVAGTSLFNNGNRFSFIFELPIQGWSSNSVASNDTDTRIITAQYKGNTGIAIVANTTNIPFSTLNYDTSASWNGTVFTAPVTGYYQFQGGVTANASVNIDLWLYKGTSPVFLVTQNRGVTTAIHGFNGYIKLNAGETVSLRSDSGFTLNNDNASHFININRLSGPAVITATETVAASYYLSANFSASTTVPINFDIKVYDTHNAVTPNLTAWKFTAPISGKYNFGGSMQASVAGTYFAVYKNGTVYAYISYDGTTGNTPFNYTMNLLAGEYVDFRPSIGRLVQGGAQSALATSSIVITRVGN